MDQSRLSRIDLECWDYGCKRAEFESVVALRTRLVHFVFDLELKLEPGRALNLHSSSTRQGKNLVRDRTQARPLVEPSARLDSSRV
jgi:hypothetical protein